MSLERGKNSSAIKSRFTDIDANRSLQRKTDQVERCVLRIDQKKEYVSKIDHLQCIRKAVDRFFQINAFI